MGIDDIEIRNGSNGKLFAIKNIRQEFNNNTMTLVADIGGDLESGNQYLKRCGEILLKGVKCQ